MIKDKTINGRTEIASMGRKINVRLVAFRNGADFEEKHFTKKAFKLFLDTHDAAAAPYDGSSHKSMPLSLVGRW